MDRTERFWAKVDRSGECWLWTGAKAAHGYGMFDGHGAHRASWEIANGPIPGGLHVLHECDNPPCVRPAHLWLGTQADNTQDMIAKGRARGSGYRPWLSMAKVGDAVKKRRVVYLSDEEWAAIQAQAETYHLTASALIRERTIPEMVPHLPPVLRPPIKAATVGPMTADRSAQQERDAILNRVNRKKTGEAQ